MSRGPHLALAAVLVLDRRVRARSSSGSGPHRGEVVLRHVVAEGMEELRRDDLGAARHLGMAGGIELDEVDLAGASRIVKPGVIPSVLPADDVHVARRRPARRCRAPWHASAVDGRSRGPTRLVNQLESGTSSMVLTFSGAVSASVSPAPRNEFSMKSNWSLISTGLGLRRRPAFPDRARSDRRGRTWRRAVPAPWPSQATRAQQDRGDRRRGEQLRGRRVNASDQKALLNLKKYWTPSPPPTADVDAEEHRLVGVEPEADAVRVLQIAKAQIRVARRDVAPVGEERHVEQEKASQRYSALIENALLSRKR